MDKKKERLINLFKELLEQPNLKGWRDNVLKSFILHKDIVSGKQDQETRMLYTDDLLNFLKVLLSDKN